MSLVNEDTSDILRHGQICPPMLYRGCVNAYLSNIFYMGIPSLAYTFTAYDLQSLFIRDVILGRIDLSGNSNKNKNKNKNKNNNMNNNITGDLLKDVSKWRSWEEELSKYSKNKSTFYSKVAELETKYIFELVKDIGESIVFEDYLNYNKECKNINGISCLDCSKIIYSWLMSKEKNILEYRDICYVSQHDSTKAIKLTLKWIDIFDDTKKFYLSCIPTKNKSLPLNQSESESKDNNNNSNNNNGNGQMEKPMLKQMDSNEIATKFYRTSSRDTNEMEMKVCDFGILFFFFFFFFYVKLNISLFVFCFFVCFTHA